VSRTLWLLYLGIHVLSAVLAGGIGYWSVVRTEMRSNRLFGLLMGGLCLWSLVAASELVLSGRASQSAVKTLYLVVGLTVPFLWVLFTAEYTHRSPRTNVVVRGLGAVYALLLPIVLTTPFHDLYAAFVFHRTPFPHTELTFGPARVLGIAYTMTGVGLGTYYLGGLFERGRSRVSTPIATLTGVVLLGAVPFLGSVFGLLPIPTYDHTPFGISVFLLGVAYLVLQHDFYHLSPIARDVILDEIEDPMIVLDSEARLVDHNTAATTVVPGLTAETIGTAFADLHPELAGLITESRPERETEITLPVEGESRRFSVRTSAISVGSDVVGTGVFLRDITELHERERQLQRQNDRLDQFASVVSHDLRNPLTVAQGRTELIAGERDDEHVAAVQDALGRMETMIDDMLRLARAGRDIEAPEQCVLAELVVQAWSNVQTPESELASRCEGVTVEADPTRLLQLFENLFRNAVDHNDPPVVVGVGPLGTGEGFYVEDDGTGIPADEREDVFEHGYTTNDGGSGLGLAIVGDIVEAHGWTITTDESDTGGARFEIRTE